MKNVNVADIITNHNILTSGYRIRVSGDGGQCRRRRNTCSSPTMRPRLRAPVSGCHGSRTGRPCSSTRVGSKAILDTADVYIEKKV